MKKKDWKIVLCLLAAVLAVSLSACGKRKKDSDGLILAYLDREEVEIRERSYEPEAGEEETAALVEELCQALEEDAPRKGIPLLEDGVEILGSELSDYVLTLDFSREYGEMEGGREILVRAGLVRTFVQIEGIHALSIQVEGEPLRDSRGNEVGLLTANRFVENKSGNVNTYTNIEMTLYFTNERGDALKPEKRKVYYSTGEPLESAVVDEVIEGPSLGGYYPVFPSDTKVQSVVIQDKVAYVNFDPSVMSSLLNVRDEIPLYAIVNSLVENCHVDKVQFSIGGESDVTYKGRIDLGRPFEKNADLVTLAD